MQSRNCFKCLWYRGNLSCLAFDEIPEEYLNGENDHSIISSMQKGKYIFKDNKLDIFNERIKNRKL